MCAEILMVRNAYFKEREVHKYTWMSEVNEEKTLIDRAYQYDIQG